MPDTNNAIINDALDKLILACNNIKSNINNAYTALDEKGAEIPDEKNIENLIECIKSITSGLMQPDVVTVTPTEIDQRVTPQEGYDGLLEVLVEAISNTYIGSGVSRKNAATYTPSTSKQTISKGQYLDGDQIIEVIPSEYTSRYDIRYYATGTFQPSSDTQSQTITNTALNGRTPKFVAVFMTNGSSYQPGITSSKYYMTSVMICTVSDTVRGSTRVEYYGSQGYNGDTTYSYITPQANGFVITCGSNTYITKTKGYRYYMIG